MFLYIHYHQLNNMNYKDLVKLTVDKMSKLSAEDDKVYMIRYMKNHFDFFGVKSPVRKTVQKEIKTFWKEFDNNTLFLFAEALWSAPQRELQYIAIDVLGSRSKKYDASYLPRIEKLILTKSWWDTVDALSPNIAGAIFFRLPEIRMLWIEKWNNSNNMWLNRSALIHQLRYKDEVDLDLLFTLVDSHIGSNEFFISKASGWALRQASKFHPEPIKNFIQDHPNLSNLTKREGSKYLS
jgi:3-methyladenine DNA glycosylase AlkD